MGRPNGRTLAGALRACAGVGGELEAHARLSLFDLAELYGFDVASIAEHLGVTDRSVRRLFAAFGVSVQELQRLGQANVSFAESPLVRNEDLLAAMCDVCETCRRVRARADRRRAA